MSAPTVANWFGDLVSHPRVVVDAHSAADIVSVLADSIRYPSPVRAVGSYHSTTPCGAADGGTIIRMRMNRILQIGADTVTVEAGATYRDIAKALEQHQLQFHVNTEIGSLSAGSAACAGTKDSSMPGEYGQVSSYVVGLKMVRPSGDLLEVTEEQQPELMRQIRSSYGTFGIVYEVTFRVRPLARLSVHHKTFKVEDFIAALPELKQLGYSMMYYLFPFAGEITVEFRRYNPTAQGQPDRHVWALRNYFWAKAGPQLAHDTERDVSDPRVRYAIIDGFLAVSRLNFDNVLRSDNTLPSDQMIQYPPVADDSRYTFSLFAFPEEEFPAVLTEYVRFNRDYYSREGYRSNLLSVGYWISQDQQSLLSYSHDGPVMTVDPVSTGNPGWKRFLGAYNDLCSDRGGIPLLNQTWGLTASHVRKALGSRWEAFAAARAQHDPENRLLSPYFRDLLGAQLE